MIRRTRNPRASTRKATTVMAAKSSAQANAGRVWLTSFAASLCLLLATACGQPTGESLTASPPPVTASSPSVTASATAITPSSWWNDRIFYEVFVRSFYDSDGDGIGDLQGLISRLDYLNDGDPSTTSDLGVTGLWLMPVMESPSYHGYDASDYYQIEQDYGSNEDFQQFVDEAHRRGMVVIIDMMLNHTSNLHSWFLDSQTPGSEHEDWYIWRTDDPGYLGPWGEQVWHPLGDRYYYGIFWSGMPDLNYENPEVTAAMQDVARFWLEDMGVDGFRLDAVRHLIEDGQTQANTAQTHEWLEGFFAYVKSVNPDDLLVGEVWDSQVAIRPYIGGQLEIEFEFT